MLPPAAACASPCARPDHERANPGACVASQPRSTFTTAKFVALAAVGNLVEGDLAAPVAVYCYTGVLAGQVKGILEANGCVHEFSVYGLQRGRPCPLHMHDTR